MSATIPTVSRGKRTRIVSLFGPVIVATVLLLFGTIRAGTSAQIPAALVTALTKAGLDRFPIYLNPAGELSLAPVISIATLVLFGWPAALAGAAAGIAFGLFNRSPREVLVRAASDLPALAIAAFAASNIQVHGPNKEVVGVFIAVTTYAIISTLALSVQMHIEEAIAWRRCLRFLVTGTFFHLGVFAAVIAAAVWTVSNATSIVDRLLIPVVAAAVTLQLYLPRILRGQEQRRVLAAVSVLAAAVDAKDPYTAGHSVSVARLCQRVARLMDLDEPEVNRVYLAALLHDVGKTVVPGEILRKPGPLTSDEYDVVRTHADAGARIVETIRGLAEVAPIVGASHEHVDGVGYPLGLKAEEIPLGARIILAVDAYDALTTDRPYRESRSPVAALRELEAHAGTQFDPRVVTALRIAVGLPRLRKAPAGPPTWVALLRQPAFGLLWGGELISFIGDNILFVALTLWILQLTGSATMLALTLTAGPLGQGLLGLLAGALADRVDRRQLIVVTDICRAALVAALALALRNHFLTIGLALYLVLNVGTVFFRTAVFALIPSVVDRKDLLTANALFQTTQRVAEIMGGVLGGAIVVRLGYEMAFYLDAGSFVFAATCVWLMPVAARAGLGTTPAKKVLAEIGEGLLYIWQTPLHRILALLIFPGYLTLAFDALQTPMVVKTAGLSAVAYGVINSALGVGKLLSATTLTGTGKQWVNVPFTVVMFLVTAIAVILFGSTTLYPGLIAAAFLFGLGNVSTIIANATLSLGNAPSKIAGRLMASRQVFIALTTLIGMLAFGRLADLVGPIDGPPTALKALGAVSGMGILAIWLAAGRQASAVAAAEAPGSGAE